MATLTVSIPDELKKRMDEHPEINWSAFLKERFKSEIKQFPWVNWSEVAREEILKKVIFEEFIKTGTLSDDDQEFCDKIDWHPVDELPLKESFVKELEKARGELSGKSMTLEELDELMGLK